MTDADRQRSIDLLNGTHDFPCPVMVKVIGLNTPDFLTEVVTAVREVLHLKFDPPIRTREARNGRHISVTLEPRFLNAEEVLDVYARIQTIEGIVMVL